MSEYTDSVESGIEGLAAVSTGTCPGCDQCREEHGLYGVEEDDEGWFEPDRPGLVVYHQSEEDALKAARERFEDDWSSGHVTSRGWGAADSEPSFSHGSCGICGSHLGGDREVWHAIIPDENGSVIGREILHSDDACIDCVVYLANGDEPEGR